jgi:hypothetical protein
MRRTVPAIGEGQVTAACAPRAYRLPVNRTPSRRWFWRFMLVLGVALAIDFLVDDKLIFAGIALIWILACFFTLSRLRKSRRAS